MRSLNRLTSLKVARAKRPGMYADGGSLYLRVAPGGSRQWIFRYTALDGRPRDMSLGAAHTFTLAEARERATEARKLRADGVDPLDHKRARMAALRAADAKAMTFRQCAEGFIRDNESEWTSARHRDEWQVTLSKYAYPLLGSMPVGAIDTPLVLKVVKPLWERIPVTAKRLLGRIENVLGGRPSTIIATGTIRRAGRDTLSMRCRRSPRSRGSRTTPPFPMHRSAVLWPSCARILALGRGACSSSR